MSSLVRKSPPQVFCQEVRRPRHERHKQKEQDFHLEISTDDLDGLYEQLRQDGIEPVEPPQDRWGDRSFLVKDPDGYWVEFDTNL